MSCVVYGCPNNNYPTAAFHYYVFPKHPTIAQQWIEACGWPPDQIDTSIARICSMHFDENSYTNEIKTIDFITCYTKVLKYDAVPTLYLPSTTQIMMIKEPEMNPEEELIVFTVPNEEDVVIQEPSDSSKSYIELQVQPATSSQQEHIKEEEGEETVDMELYRQIQTHEQLKALQNKNKTLRTRVENMEENLKVLKQVLSQQIRTYREKDLELSRLHQDYLKTKRSFLSMHDQKVLLSKVFSESQIKILSGKKKIYWSDDDMAVGYTIRHLSNKRCYMYLTKDLNIPLPAVSSIKRWMTLKNSAVKKSLDGTPSDVKKNDNESEDSE